MNQKGKPKTDLETVFNKVIIGTQISEMNEVLINVYKPDDKPHMPLKSALAMEGFG